MRRLLLDEATVFQSTLSVRRATYACRTLQRRFGISIHALREESDASTPTHPRLLAISIHALREESDASTPMMPFARLFQSTLSVRRATSRGVIRGSSL